ncbi:MAG TPA: hypothetical protein VJT49_19410 [Amycolatopsis sp.]|uniref:hypothetical protein n=1 Tax=Amycolatopsis sp. TaxID=37632 RepID=UPI002B46B2B3|nr:hypothetical protein [Amycolatopsis sp.]HKS47235.1 hypothetical protein [Amycolatopsis sp.]
MSGPGHTPDLRGKDLGVCAQIGVLGAGPGEHSWRGYQRIGYAPASKRLYNALG